jgi:hypothetical protein
MAIVRATPAPPRESRHNAALIVFWSAMLLLGAACALVMATGDAHIGFPTGALLGGGFFGLWQCRRSRTA